MNKKTEKCRVRDQYELDPYPSVPVDCPIEDQTLLFNYCYSLAQYLRSRKFDNGEGRRIIDLGCGTGYKTAHLSKANPQAQVLGVDFSARSIKLANERKKFHNLTNLKFKLFDLDNLDKIEEKYDLINCQDVLYLSADPVRILQGMTKMLTEDGIIRLDFHAIHTRAPILRAQAVFKKIFGQDTRSNPEKLLFVTDFMKSLTRSVNLRELCWDSGYENNDKLINMNHLLESDKAWSLNQIFQALKAADLQFIEMVNWPGWKIENLFEYQSLPPSIQSLFANLNREEILEISELLHPWQRLHDLWCSSPCGNTPLPPESWDLAAWGASTIHLHPVLATVNIRQMLSEAISSHTILDFRLGHSFSLPFHLDIFHQRILLELWSGPKVFEELLGEYIISFCKFNLSEVTSALNASQWLVRILLKLSSHGYIFPVKKD